ncbi:hypothetical protein RR46_04385 [Papilio xuthus]|uniref:Uncharacterized protein n=1 Tax=Papilio xuthus TaxID=66420 RepID=A0A194PLW3_PAPXU|nr:hypothetical protein RR46_04385 [Papilio xuthus]
MPAPEQNIQSNTEGIVEQPSREISQSEPMNKKLIANLLKTVIKGGDPTIAKMFELEKKTEGNDERKCSCNPNPQ